MQSPPKTIQQSLMASLLSLFLLLIYYYSTATASASPLPPLLTLNCTPTSLQSIKINKLIKILLHNLTVEATQTHFATLIIGQEPYRIDGLVQCRLDISLTQCTICVKSAKHTISTLCPNSEAVTAWFDGCYIQYYNHYKFSHAIQVLESTRSNTSHVEDQVQFNLALDTLLLRLRAQVSLASHRGFSQGEIGYGNNGSSGSRVYAVAECLRLVSPKDCEVCVGEAIKKIHECCGGKEGGRVVAVAGFCMVRFESYRFFSNRTADSSNGSDVVVSNYDVNESDGRVGLREKVGLVWGVGVAIVVLVVLGAWLLRRKVVNAAKVSMESAHSSEVKG